MVALSAAGVGKHRHVHADFEAEPQHKKAVSNTSPARQVKNHGGAKEHKSGSAEFFHTDIVTLGGNQPHVYPGWTIWLDSTQGRQFVAP
jgi:hypothetical protein